MATAVSLVNPELRLARYYAGKLARIYEQYQNGGAAMTAALQTLDSEWAQISHWQRRISPFAVEDTESARVVTDFARYSLAVRQSFAERAEWLQTGLDAARFLGDSLKEALMLTDLSLILQERGETENSRVYADQGLEAAQKSGDENTIMYAQLRVANAARWMGELDTTEKLCQEVLASPTLDKNAEILVCNILAQAAVHRGNIPKAIELCNRMLELVYQTGNLYRLSIALYMMSLYYFMLGHLDQSEHYLDESLHLTRLLHDRNGLPNSLMLRALIAIDLGHLTAAHTHAVEQELIAREVDSTIQVILAQTEYGAIERLRGNYAESRRQYELARTTAHGIQNFTTEMDAVLGLLHIALDAGDYDEAAEYCQLLLAESNAHLVDPTMFWLPHLGLGLIASTKGEYEEALRHFEESIPLANDVNTNLIEIYSTIAETQLHVGNLEAAREAIQQAEAVAQKFAGRGFPYLTSVHATRIKVHLRAREFESARATLRDVLHDAEQLEYILPRLHVIEAAAEYLAIAGDIRCISLFSLVAHHPASKGVKGKAMEQRRDEIAPGFDANEVAMYWEQGIDASLDGTIKELFVEYSSDPDS